MSLSNDPIIRGFQLERLELQSAEHLEEMLRARHTPNMTATEAVARANQSGHTNTLTTEMIRRAVRTLEESSLNDCYNPFWYYATLFNKKPKNHQYELDFEPKYVKWEHKVIFDSVTMEEL